MPHSWLKAKQCLLKAHNYIPCGPRHCRHLPTCPHAHCFPAAHLGSFSWCFPRSPHLYALTVHLRPEDKVVCCPGPSCAPPPRHCQDWPTLNGHRTGAPSRPLNMYSVVVLQNCRLRIRRALQRKGTQIHKENIL